MKQPVRFDRRTWVETGTGLLIPEGTNLGQPKQIVKPNQTFYESMQARCEHCIDLLIAKGFSDGTSAKGLENIRELLLSPDTSVEKSFGVTLSDGKHHIFKGFLVVDDEIIRPVKGGCRASKHLDLETDKALARGMTLKCFLNKVKYGGAKAGIVVDLSEHSEADQEAIVKGWARAFKDFLGPTYYISAPDVGTGPQFADWVHDALTYTTPAGRSIAGSIITGKSVEVGGVIGRAGSTGLGMVYAAEIAVQHFENRSLDGKTVIIEGLGKVGSSAAEHFPKHGATVIGVKEYNGGIWNPEGMDVGKLLAHWRSKKTFEGFNEGEFFTGQENEGLLERRCNILAPSARENTITSENAGRIQADYIDEGGNGSITTDALRILAGRGKKVLVDIFANAGGVRWSWFEDQQERTGGRFMFDELDQKFKAGISETFGEIVAASKKWDVDLGTAAYMLAIENQAKHHLKKGLRP